MRGTDIWVPRNYDHAKAVWDEYSWSHVPIAGIYRTEGGCGSCTSYAMNSDALASYSGVGWTSVADEPEPWFLRSTPYSEPNGDYTANCWLDIYGWDDNEGFGFNDASCSNCADHYLCSTNGDAELVMPTPQPSTPELPRPVADVPGCFDDDGDDDVMDLWKSRHDMPGGVMEALERINLKLEAPALTCTR